MTGKSSEPLLVDRATGSRELAEPLKRMGLPVDLTHLDFGDVAFLGRGEKGAPLYVGIELKKIGELVQSLSNHRFQGHQLLGLSSGFDRRYLLIEGDYHHDADGHLIVFRAGRPRPLHGRTSAVGFEEELINLDTRGGIRLRHTSGRRDTLRVITALYRYWTDKDLDEHKSHLAIYSPDMDPGLLTPPSDFRRALQVLLPGIGFAASRAVEEAAEGSWRRLMLWTEKQWSEVAMIDRKGNVKRLGTKRARAIMEVLK